MGSVGRAGIAAGAAAGGMKKKDLLNDLDLLNELAMKVKDLLNDEFTDKAGNYNKGFDYFTSNPDDLLNWVTCCVKEGPLTEGCKE